MLTATALVLFMTLPGLALFYGGLVHRRNVLSVFIHVVAVACLASVLWFVVGYSLAFGDGGSLNAYIGGLDKAFLRGVTIESESGTIPETVFFMFQMTFAIITPALIIGAYVERIRFPAVLLFSGLWLLFVYFPVAHWVWAPGGWLFEAGVRDFAGGLVVHTTAGVSAIVLAMVLRNRLRFPHDIKPPHSPGLAVMGAAMLWVGWFGFSTERRTGCRHGDDRDPHRRSDRLPSVDDRRVATPRQGEHGRHRHRHHRRRPSLLLRDAVR